MGKLLTIFFLLVGLNSQAQRFPWGSFGVLDSTGTGDYILILQPPQTTGIISIGQVVGVVADSLGIGSPAVDSVWRIAGTDSIYWRRGGTEFKIKDSTGGGGAGEWGAISGEINSQTDLMDTLGYYLKKADTSTLSARIDLKVNITDTAAMLTYYDQNGRNFFRKALTADTSTSSTSAVQVFGLSFYSPANTKWVVTVAGTCSKATTTTGLKVSVQAPTAAVVNGFVQRGAAAASTALTNEIITAINTLSATFSTGAGVRVPFRQEYTIEVGANAGWVGVGFATVTSNAATIYQGTSITAEKL